MHKGEWGINRDRDIRTIKIKNLNPEKCGSREPK
jgi:hypothetical protein